VALEFFDDVMTIAEDRKFGEHSALNNEGTKKCLSQVVQLLEIVHLATKYLEGDTLPTIAMVIPTILNALIQLESPEVIIFDYY